MALEFDTFLDYVEEKRHHVSFLSFFLLVLVGFLDYSTGYALGFSLFYLVPVIIIAWSSGVLPAFFLSCVSAFLWTGGDFLAGLQYDSLWMLLWNIIVRGTYFIIVIVIVDQLHGALRRERIMADHDSLTNLANQRYFYERMALAVDSAQRYKRPISFAYIDCDNFKHVNDSFGHGRGDELLRLIADHFKSSVRSLDVVGRLGGDEFIIMFPETGADEVKGILERIIGELHERVKEREFTVTFSVGVSTFLSMLYSLDKMIQYTDALMYKAKKSGKNRIVYDTIKGLSARSQ